MVPFHTQLVVKGTTYLIEIKGFLKNSLNWAQVSFEVSDQISTMKTTKFKKLLFMFTLISLVAVGCGRNNVSGTKSRNNGLPGVGGIGVGGVGGLGTSSPLAGIVLQENPCISGAGRMLANIPLTMMTNVAINSTYIGVTSEGDVATITNMGQGPILTLHLCQRPGLTSGQGQLTQNPVINSSRYCRVDEITAASVVLQSTMGMPYSLNFRALHFGSSAQRPFSVCL